MEESRVARIIFDGVEEQGLLVTPLGANLEVASVTTWSATLRRCFRWLTADASRLPMGPTSSLSAGRGGASSGACCASLPSARGADSPRSVQQAGGHCRPSGAPGSRELPPGL